MNRRDFLATGAGGALGATLNTSAASSAAARSERAAVAGSAGATDSENSVAQGAADVRSVFPRLERDIFINAAAGTPMGAFVEGGLREFEEAWRFGADGERGEAFNTMLAETRQFLAELLGATPTEIAFVQCTKAGEQIVIDGMDALRSGGNIVTNDLHFNGSLHNLVGLRQTGVDVRIVRSVDWSTDVAAMAAAIDDDTALVSLTLLSNINGHIEPIREIADIAHAHGAYVYADVIQATGIVPIDVDEMGIDFAAGNGYKWLLGPHGTGFLYVRQELQGTGLADHMFPGPMRPNFQPWVAQANPDLPAFPYAGRADAQRYQVGHQAYLCYAALHRGLGFVRKVGLANAQEHTVRLNKRLLAGVDAQRYACISPHVERSSIITFLAGEGVDIRPVLRAANVVVSVSGGNRIRVSPAIYNDEADIDALITTLNGA